MGSRLIVLALCLSCLAVAPAAAAAATIAVDRGCYANPTQRADTVKLTGAGFTPNAQYQVTLDGQPLAGGTGTTDAAGNIVGSFTSPELAAGVRQHRFVLGVQEGANAPETSFTVSKLAAAFTPSSGDPTTLKVRFRIFGFGLAGRASPPVYVHYVAPSGKLRRTVKLGTGRGACGAIIRTKERRLFPFAARKGTWRLQFDSRYTYRRGTKASEFLFFAVAVKIQ